MCWYDRFKLYNASYCLFFFTTSNDEIIQPIRALKHLTLILTTHWLYPFFPNASRLVIWAGIYITYHSIWKCIEHRIDHAEDSIQPPVTEVFSRSIKIRTPVVLSFHEKKNPHDLKFYPLKNVCFVMPSKPRLLSTHLSTMHPMSLFLTFAFSFFSNNI